MPAPRITALSIGGLVTAPGKEAFSPGACSRLRNVKFIGANKLKGMQSYSTPVDGGGNGHRIDYSVEFKNNKFATVAASGGGWITNGGGNTTQNYTIPSYATSSYVQSGGYFSPLMVRDRVLFQSTFGVWATDYADPDFTVAAQRVWRSAGLPQPQICTIAENPGATIPNNTMVSYGVMFRRVYSDGYELRSPGSVVQLMMNNSGAAVDNIIKVQWAYSDDIKAGDYVELYRSIGLNSASVSYSPTFDTGSTLYLVAKVQLTSSDATSKFLFITDLQPMTAPDYATSGEQWYPGPTAEGSDQQDNQPPRCLVQCAWKGQAFYGNYVEYPTINLQAKATVGNLTTAWDRTNGIGVRSGAGTITFGSANITGVPAADLENIKVGQVWYGNPSYFSNNERVIAVGASSITMNGNASGGGSGWSLADQVLLDGNYYRCAFLGDLVQQIGLSGLFEVTASENLYGEMGNQTGVRITIRPIHYRSSFTIRATNGQNYLDAIPDSTATALTITGRSQPNIVRYSKTKLPEAVPYNNEIPVGLGQIIAMVPTTNYLYCWTTDGLYSITGVEGNFRVDCIDQSAILGAPRATSAMNERVYGITNRGLVRVSVESGIETLSRGVFDSLIPGIAFRAQIYPWLQCDASNEEVWILHQGLSGSTPATIYIWNNRFQSLSEVYLSGAVGTFNNGFVTSININSGYEFGLPAITVGLYTSISTKPKYAVFDGGAALPVDVMLRELGDSNTVKQWIDYQVMVETLGIGETVVSKVSFPDGSPNGTGTLSNARNDSRISFGIPRSDAIRPEIRLGFQLPTPTRALEILGISTRVVPKTTQSEVR